MYDYHQLTTATAWRVVGIVWIVWLAYWGISALRVQKARETESPTSRLSYGVIVWVGAILLFWRRLPLGPLHHRFLVASPGVLGIGIALTCCGLLLAIWSRVALGRYWSGTITIKADHQLIRSGPYARIRHPIYTGILLGMIGTALVAGTWQAVLGVVLIYVAFVKKGRIEEEWLAREFGPAFEEHRRRTGRFVPRLF